MAADQVMAWGRGGWLFGAAGDAVLAWPTRRDGQPAHEEDPTGAAVWDSGRLLEALLISEDGRAAVGAPPAPTRVLELGAGTGDLAHALAAALPSISQYDATDLPERAAAHKRHGADVLALCAELAPPLLSRGRSASAGPLRSSVAAREPPGLSRDSSSGSLSGSLQV